METVLVVGSSGNIGVSAIIAAQRSNRAVMAVVRGGASKQKILSHIDSSENVTFVEADVTSDDGLQDVVDRVRKGDLPPFQHVFATVGHLNWTTPIQSLDLDSFREVMKVSLEANYLAYRATIPYLIERGGNPTFTLMTGGAGDLGIAGVTAIGQGALFSLASVACLENMKTNIRFNELYLSCRVEYDSNIDDKNPQGKVKASKFAQVYERILHDENINGCRVRVTTAADIDELKYEKKLPDYMYHS